MKNLDVTLKDHNNCTNQGVASKFVGLDGFINEITNPMKIH